MINGLQATWGLAALLSNNRAIGVLAILVGQKMDRVSSVLTHQATPPKERQGAPLEFFFIYSQASDGIAFLVKAAAFSTHVV